VAKKENWRQDTLKKSKAFGISAYILFSVQSKLCRYNCNKGKWLDTCACEWMYGYLVRM